VGIARTGHVFQARLCYDLQRLEEARQVDGARQAAVGNLGVEAVLRRRNFYVDNWDDHNLTKIMEEGGVHIIRGHGRLDGRKRVLMTSTDGGGVSTLLSRFPGGTTIGVTSTFDIPRSPDGSSFVPVYVFPLVIT